VQQGTTTQETSGSADLVYLTAQQKKWSSAQSQCRLFTIRANEALDAYKQTAIQLKEKATFTRGLPLHELYTNIMNAPSSNLHTEAFASYSIFTWHHMVLCTIVSILSFLGAIASLSWLKRSQFALHHLALEQINSAQITLLTSCFTTMLLCFYLVINQQNDSDDLFLMPMSIGFAYTLGCLGILFFFNIKSVRTLFNWYHIRYSFVQTCLLSLFTMYCIVCIGQWLNELKIFSIPLWQFYQSLFVLSALAMTFIHMMYYYYTNKKQRVIKRYGLLLKNILALYAIALLGLVTLGYLILSLQLLYASFVCSAIFMVMSAFIYGLEKLYRFIKHNQRIHQQIILYFGYRREQTLHEFLTLKITMQLMILVSGLFFMAKATSFAGTSVEWVYEQLINGVHLGNMTLYPVRIFIGVVLFCCIFLTSRALSTKISGHQQFEDEEETQVAVASILNYIGFGLAFTIGALAAGFDFTGLAIIAGALSVGIGLGLQSIVNNFVSGLIILIEKPIKPGDRINIDGVEGFVKKIRVRSTQLMTSAHEDIIIPNSDLITKRVTNYMLTDKYCRVNIEVSVAYGSNTHVVRDTLLDIATQHPDILKTERHKPGVVFQAFGENALVFQLSCLIKDVNKKSAVQSDLHFSIEQIFRERNIDMPFVQREIHLKMNNIPPFSPPNQET
jgi:small-conductance mechanosensitive channel